MIITRDLRMKNLLEIADNIAQSKAAILIQGESGTGKESFAKYIHAKSSRASQRIISCNCNTSSESLLDIELFGGLGKPGKLEVAGATTLLLEEVSELPLNLQVKLLKVLQAGELEKGMGRAPVRITARIISTTHKKLENLVRQNKFREDLYYRLNVIPLEIPSLAERKIDIALLAQYFVEVACHMNNKPTMKLEDAAVQKLQAWIWPGNVRELESVIERAVVLTSGEILKAESIQTPEQTPQVPDNLIAGMTLMEAERKLILKTLEFTKQNRTKAAQLLGISIRTLRNKIHEYKGEATL